MFGAATAAAAAAATAVCTHVNKAIYDTPGGGCGDGWGMANQGSDDMKAAAVG